MAVQTHPLTEHARVEQALGQLVAECRGTGDNYLVVGVGDFYLQFLKDAADDALQCEAVSNNFLEGGQRLSPSVIERLRACGYEDPDAEVTPSTARTPLTAAEVAKGAPASSPNFFKYADISTTEAIRALAEEAVHLLREVYATDPATPIEVRLSLNMEVN